jgi:hypothetical protein
VNACPVHLNPPFLAGHMTGHFRSYKHRTDHELATVPIQVS